MEQPSPRSQPEDATRDEPSGQEAIILKLPRLNPESLRPDELSDTDCIALFAAAWQHPSIHSSQLVATIVTDTKYKESDPWKQRMSDIVQASPLMDRFDEFIDEDSLIASIVAFMQETINDANALKLERAAANILMKLRAIQITIDPDHPDTSIRMVLAKLKASL